jgi:hypothetical protein
MRNSEKARIAADAIRGGYLAGHTAIIVGAASVKTTILFGLITTGSVISIPVVGAWALAGTLLAATATYGSYKLRHHLVKKEFDKMKNE